MRLVSAFILVALAASALGAETTEVPVTPKPKEPVKGKPDCTVTPIPAGCPGATSPKKPDCTLTPIPAGCPGATTPTPKENPVKGAGGEKPPPKKPVEKPVKEGEGEKPKKPDSPGPKRMDVVGTATGSPEPKAKEPPKTKEPPAM